MLEGCDQQTALDRKSGIAATSPSINEMPLSETLITIAACLERSAKSLWACIYEAADRLYKEEFYLG